MKTTTSWIFILIFCLWSTSTFAQKSTAGIQFFKGSWEEALAKAKEDNKPIFVDAYTVWCGPCKKMAKVVFTDPVVGQFYNKHYVNYKMDVEKGEGIDFAKKYKVNRYPTLLFINGEGELLKKVVGFRQAPNFLAEGRKGLFDEKMLAKLEKEYKEGKRDAGFIREYIHTLYLAESPELQRISYEYLGELTKEQQLEKENMEIAYMLANGINSRPFNILLEHRESFEKEYSQKVIQQKIIEIAGKSLQSATKNKDKKLFTQVLETFEASNSPRANELVSQASLHYYAETANWKKYAKTALKYLDAHEVNDANYLNNIAWKFYLHVKSKKKLAKAEQWIAKSISLNSNYHNNDTHAAILYKLGKKTEAIQAAEKAIAIAKLQKKDPKSTKELLDKILTN